MIFLTNLDVWVLEWDWEKNKKSRIGKIKLDTINPLWYNVLIKSEKVYCLGRFNLTTQPGDYNEKDSFEKPVLPYYEHIDYQQHYLYHDR